MRSSFDVERGAASRPYMYTAVNDPNRHYNPARSFRCGCISPAVAMKQLVIISFIGFVVLYFNPQIYMGMKPSSCPLGNSVYWVLAHSVHDNKPLSCNTVCNDGSSLAICAGDYPTYSGWPYTEEALVDIIAGLDQQKYQRLVNCYKSDVMFLNDTMIPQFYYMDDKSRRDDCSPFFLMKPEFSYKCDSIPQYTTNILCPCCKVTAS